MQYIVGSSSICYTTNYATADEAVAYMFYSRFFGFFRPPKI